MSNQTSVTEFLLLGVTDIQEPQPFLFAIFFTIYFVNLTGNGAILTIIISDPRLHSPMYFFLGNLACLDICYSTVTVPKMLENFLSTSKAISFLGCITQLHFFHFLGTTESLLLAVMAFDRFVAICKPLHYSAICNPLRYTAIMNPQLCVLLAAMAWIISFFYALMHSVMTAHLNFCHSHKLSHFFCDVKPLLEVACGNTVLNQWLLSVVTGSISMTPFLCIILSYLSIISNILRIQSSEGRHKAFSTCASHLLIVLLYYGSAIFTYVRPISSYSLEKDRLISVLYSVVTPMLNPVIYTLRNKDIKEAVKTIGRKWQPLIFSSDM
ncbi:Olfactory receptor 12D1 [Lemmus lemmus]